MKKLGIGNWAYALVPQQAGKPERLKERKVHRQHGSDRRQVVFRQSSPCAFLSFGFLFRAAVAFL
jgi:hypothetical protein